MAELADGNRERIWRVLGNAYSSPTFSRIWEERIETMVAEIATEHVTAALDEIERRIEAASWFTFDDNDVSPDEEFVRRSDAQHIVRGYRQEQDR